MPKQVPSFSCSKINKRSCVKKMSSRTENPNVTNLAKQKIEVLKSPIQSESDKKEYKVITLPNNLRALLISDLNSKKGAFFDSGELASQKDESEEESGSSSASSSEESESEDSQEENDEESDGNVSDEGGRKHYDSGEEKMAACALCVGVGSFSDPKEIQGLAHFVEHMVFMGSKKFPKENDFDSFIKKKGGSDNASTDCEITTFYFEIQENYLEEAMDKFSQFFVYPLMKQEAMQREREAIESEFALATPSDSNRRDQLLAGLLPPGHPARTFMWGNLRSLSAPLGPADAALHKAAHDFRKRHYSAHRMTLTLQARLPIEVLEKYVLSTFGQISDNNLPADDFATHTFKPEDISPEFSSLYYMKPINHVSEIHLTWCMRSFFSEYRGKPHQYVSWILGHEGAGSLLSYLRKKVWALGIYTGNSESGIDHTSLLCFFTVSIILTAEGLKFKEDVIDAVFSYVNMLRGQCPNERIFREIQSIEEINFKFEEDSQPCDNVENLVENMHFYPPEHYITGADLFYDYKPDDIKYVLDCMVPDKVNIMIVSQEHTEPIEYDQVEEWFHTDYKKCEIPSKHLDRWKTIEPYKEFHLPDPNIYIPDDFELIPLPAELSKLIDEVNAEVKTATPAADKVTAKSKKRDAEPKAGEPEVVESEELKAKKQAIKTILDAPPALIVNDELLELWYKPDYKFRHPNAFIYIHLVSPIPSRSAVDACLVDMWCHVLKQILTEKLYAADMAGLSHSLFAMEKGLVLKLSGFKQKLPILVDVITKTMKNYEEYLSKELFDAIRDIQTKNYTNSVYKPSKLVKDMRFTLILKDHHTNMKKLEALGSVTYEDMRAIGSRFLESLHCQLLVQGCILREEALRVANTLKENLRWTTLREEDRPKIEVYEIPEGSHYCRVNGVNKSNGNSNITNYYQSGTYTLKESCIIEFIMMLMEEPLFNTLRTKEQLGYNVFCLLRYSFSVLGYSITVNMQADKYSADHVDNRIESFLQKFGQDLQELAPSALEQVRRALVKLKRCVDVELKEEAFRHWGEIVSREYNFNRTAQEIECVKSITLEEVQEWFTEHSLHGNKKNFKKLSLQVIGHKTTDSPSPVPAELEELSIYDSKHLLHLINGQADGNGDNGPKNFITNMDSFTDPLVLFPQVEYKIPEIATD